MKLTDIFCSLLILTLVIFMPALFYRTNSKLGGGLDIFAFYLVIWIVTSCISPILLGLLKFKLIKRTLAFPLTLLVVFNLYFGLYGVYLALSSQVFHPGRVALIFFILNLVWALLISIYAINYTSKTPS